MSDKFQDLARRDVLVGGANLLTGAALISVPGAKALGADATQKLGPGATPFSISIPQNKIDRIMGQLQDIAWPHAPEVADPWKYGASVAAMKDLVAHWTTKYDWRAREAKLNKFHHFKARIDGYDIHFVHERGSGPNPQPLIISHGWPSTFTEFDKVIEPLAHPERFGGRIEDAFTVVVPSLPGMGFSSKPSKPISTSTVAAMWEKLMHDVLGYSGYIAQGGDLGYAITRELGYVGHNCKAIHLNLLIGGGPPQNEEEKKAQAIWDTFNRDQGAYMHVNRTTPLTIAYAMENSPVGTAAWLLEKFRWWSDVNGDPWSVYTRDEILDTIMIYLVTNTFGTAAWYYAGGREESPPPPRTGKVEKPTGFAHFPKDIVFWPRTYADRYFNVVRWTEMAAGGHFAAAEVPQLFAEEVRAFARQLKA